MKPEIKQMLLKELLSDSLNEPILTICKVSRLYINKDLIEFIRNLISDTEEAGDKIKMLIKLKKVVIQTERQPDYLEQQLEADNFRQFFISIKKEQDFYEPIKWIEAELDCLNTLKSIQIKPDQVINSISENKQMLNKDEMLKAYNISISTLKRRIAEGMPAVKMGAKMMFNRNKVNAWLDLVNQ